MHSRLKALTDPIAPVDASLVPAIQARLDDLTKPQGSLGRMEELALRLALIQGGGKPQADPAALFTCAGDHGVAQEGVSLFPQEVTRQMVLNFMGGGAGINVLARQAGAELVVVDAGCAGPDFPEHPGLVRAKVAPGTQNMAKGPAMTIEQCLQALELGASLASQAAGRGVRVIGTGDMGIANTTPSTALYCAFLDLTPEAVAGPGTGLAPEAVSRKARVIETCLAVNREAVASGDPLAILAALGGYEIACIAGLILGGAANRQAVLVDGFISTAACVAAMRMAPAVKDYCFFSHASAEPGHKAVMRALDANPLLDLGLRLGEGTGAALALMLLRASAAVLNEMATFSQAGVSRQDG
ncbi:Nicotinate-nucleotide--dimethylbenzimidazole phosphoribosyltransferase [Fundidesulfovibrio magnetotacticus]|uniref:Nicotinate-nucleotide--dimethylbenzimidazole phosphoribosyltransferase n=1 Tax=Fundidesulfovibrio magnetotacticus TaxID=2730080 RepID=A0A6V8LQL3_9BACT|nr:nicotinate-nucleotide--dimethylbenzimidazole phosphoribosyltransferase [Fundidesulfovibrio magnetotacticus]GFK93270.1 Nicotinate-nucleotide--dimethylbenzimidazole phosphoribosyltransferase [Fundidesulfovibrio magnetotacticus]